MATITKLVHIEGVWGGRKNDMPLRRCDSKTTDTFDFQGIHVWAVTQAGREQKLNWLGYFDLFEEWR